MPHKENPVDLQKSNYNLKVNSQAPLPEKNQPLFSRHLLAFSQIQNM